MPNESDQALLVASLDDREAVGILYERYRDRIFRWLMCTVMDRDVAEDLTETVFARMVDNLPRLARSNVPLLPWLYRVAHNETVSWYRHNHSAQRYLKTARLPDCCPDTDYDEAVADAENHRDELRAAAGRLTPFERECLHLRYVEEMKPREIALVLSCSARQASNALHHALSVLRTAISDNLPGSRYPNREVSRS